MYPTLPDGAARLVNFFHWMCDNPVIVVGIVFVLLLVIGVEGLWIAKLKLRAAQPASAAQPPAEELEAQCRTLAVRIHLKLTASSKSKHFKWLAAELQTLVRTHQAARERELLEKLEGLAAKWEDVGKETMRGPVMRGALHGCTTQLRALIAEQREEK